MTKKQSLSIETVEEKEPELLFTRPELLLHPNLPKPLHGLNPRTVMGQKWWNNERRRAYATNNYHCWACGTYRNFNLDLNKFCDDSGESLDAHECYRIDYEKKEVELVEIVAICKNCHQYIHSGRTNSLYEKGVIDEKDCFIVFSHGDSILIDAGLIPCNEVDTNTYQEEWNEWKLIIDGKEHYSKFKDYFEWYKHYMIG